MRRRGIIIVLALILVVIDRDLDFSALEDRGVK